MSQFLPPTELLLPAHLEHLSPTEYLSHLVSIAEKYNDLTSLHIVHFLSRNFWDMIDPEWQQALMQPESEDEFIDDMLKLASRYECKSSWPESLKAYVEEMKNTQLPSFDPEQFNTDHLSCTIDRHLLSGMSEKKAHEVETLGMLIKHVADATDMTSIIDLGAGQGYLSRMLALQHGLHVLAVDADEIQTCGAKFYQGKAEKSIKGKNIRALVATEEDPTEAIAKEKERQSHLNHVTQMITLENIPTLLADWTDTSRWNYREVPAKSWMICGLHTCGDLAPTIIRLFQGSPEIGGMISVGCCYHWLTEEKDAQGTYAFPMSTQLIDYGYKLGPTLRMLACQAPGRWETQREATVKSFKHNFYRTMLQKIMVDKGLATIKVAPVVGRMNHKRDFTTFPVYVKAALRRFDLSGTITDEEAIEFEAQAREDGQYRKMIILWTLRILLSPIIESIILVDRWVYLKDTLPNAKICMWPLFNKVASPRNVVIAALKEGTTSPH